MKKGMGLMDDLQARPPPACGNCTEGPHPLLPPQTQPWDLFISAELKWQKCHHWAPGERKAKKIKGISDEMLICFWKQVGAAGAPGPWGLCEDEVGLVEAEWLAETALDPFMIYPFFLPVF